MRVATLLPVNRLGTPTAGVRLEGLVSRGDAHMFSQRTIETLERRTLFSVAQISFPNFSDSSHLVENGYDSDKVIVGDRLRLTDNKFHQARSVWYDQAVPIEKFRA